MTLGDLIYMYRHEHGLSMSEFSEAVGLSKSYIGFLEKNSNPTSKKAIIPSINVIEKVAEVLGMSFEECYASIDPEFKPPLKDRMEDAPDVNECKRKFSLNPKKIILNRIAERRKELGITMEKIAMLSGISIAKLAYYEQIDPNMINEVVLKKIASNLGVSVDYLLEKTDEVPSSQMSDYILSKDEIEAIQNFRKLNEIGRARLLGQLAMMTEIEEYKH